MIGLAFKGSPETNDMRNSPSLELVHLFSNLNKRILGWDAVIENSIISDECQILEESSRPRIFLLMNNHEKNVEKIVSILEKNHDFFWVFDPWRLILDPKEFLRYAPQGFTYITLSNSREFYSHD
jgi:UDP-N-acetyl-D-mannosaminuronate dehydrogenase